jgi:hypothetical protein
MLVRQLASVFERFRLSRLLGIVVVLLMSVVCFSQISPGNDSSNTSSQLHFAGMWKQPYFVEVMVASVFGWVLGMVKGFSGAKDWLAKYWPNSPRLVIFVLDLVIFVVCGAFFGTGIYNPSSLQAALAAGLSWPVGLGALVTK